MTEPNPSPEDISAWKAQQEANRLARQRQLQSPAELWRAQQAALDALAKLRPDGCRPARRPPAEALEPDNVKTWRRNTP
jgi:hypothetical protein